MRAAEIDRSQAEDKDDRELLETIYSAMVTAEPTALNPHPPPGLIQRVENIEAALGNRTFEGEITGTHLSGTIDSHKSGD